MYLVTDLCYSIKAPNNQHVRCIINSWLYLSILVDHDSPVISVIVSCIMYNVLCIMYYVLCVMYYVLMYYVLYYACMYYCCSWSFWLWWGNGRWYHSKWIWCRSACGTQRGILLSFNHLQLAHKLPDIIWVQIIKWISGQLNISL